MTQGLSVNCQFGSIREQSFDMTDMTDMKNEKDLEGLDGHTPASNHDDVFGELSEGGPNYRNVRV